MAESTGICESAFRRYLGGDEGAVNEIMDELFFKLVFFVDGYVHDIHSAEDIAMDAMSDLFVRKHRYNFRVSLKTYVFMLGKSRALDFLRHRKAIQMTDLSEAEDLSDDRAELENSVLRDERSRELHAAIGRLPEQLREAVWLVYFEELSYDEAARVMKKNRKQIDNLLYRARKELRTMLGGDDHEGY